MNINILETEVAALTGKTIPLHMPGHKRMLKPSQSLPYDLDITEIVGADDLHGADGILKKAMERASKLWGSGRTWFLVGGSTCGILAGIRAAVPFGGEIIAARNCHRSVFHAIELVGCKVRWILPGQDRTTGVCLGITPKQVADCIKRHPFSAAVILTSPTYEGVISDVRAIAEICHSAGIPLLVDEAHGPHLGLFKEGGFPEGAVKCGADLVVQSAHKTLPSLTQTALLHLQSRYIEESEVERQLGIFETSSPSYPLMISIDSCVGLMRGYGGELFKMWKERLDRFYEGARQLSRIKVWEPEEDTEEESGDSGRRADGRILRDRSKILISFRKTGVSGAKAASVMREKYGIETEMYSGYNVLAMTGLGDADDDLKKLLQALCAMDKAIAARGGGMRRPEPVPAMPKVRTACTVLTAAGSACEEVPLEEAADRICGEYLYAYPPGIPLLAPGEYIGEEHITLIIRSEESGNPIHRTHSGDARRIACLKE